MEEPTTIGSIKNIMNRYFPTFENITQYFTDHSDEKATTSTDGHMTHQQVTQLNTVDTRSNENNTELSRLNRLTGLLKGNGTQIVQAVANTDYITPTKLNTELDKKTIDVTSSDSNDENIAKVYTITQGNTSFSINIPRDIFFNSGEVITDQQTGITYLKLVLNSGNEVLIDVRSLIDIYRADNPANKNIEVTVDNYKISANIKAGGVSLSHLANDVLNKLDINSWVVVSQLPTSNIDTKLIYFTKDSTTNKYTGKRYSNGWETVIEFPSSELNTLQSDLSSLNTNLSNNYYTKTDADSRFVQNSTLNSYSTTTQMNTAINQAISNADFAPTSHTHNISNIVNLQTNLDNKASVTALNALKTNYLLNFVSSLPSASSSIMGRFYNYQNGIYEVRKTYNSSNQAVYNWVDVTNQFSIANCANFIDSLLSSWNLTYPSDFHPATTNAPTIWELLAYAVGKFSNLSYSELSNTPTVANTVASGNTNAVSSGAVYNYVNTIIGDIDDFLGVEE